jgi:hypothetical protein
MLHFIFFSASMNRHNSILTGRVGSNVNASHFNAGESDMNLAQESAILTEGFHGFP